MLLGPRTSIAVNFFKSIYNSQKKIQKELIEKAVRLECRESLFFTEDLLSRYCHCIGWQKSEIPPTFPYALVTHMHFSLVNDKNFPFAPLGLIHKREKISCQKALTRGKWKARAKVDQYREVASGYEIDIVTELEIDAEPVWKSVTTAFKKTKTGGAKKNYPPLNIKEQQVWRIPAGLGREYGAISNNIDLIHISTPTAKLMGHKSAIIHGMWSLARGLSSAVDRLDYPFNVEASFKTPIAIPSEVLFAKRIREDGVFFGVYSKEGTKPYYEAILWS